MPASAGMLTYLINGIEGSPTVMSALLSDLGPDDPRWDARPDPDRFTLREMAAHVADWDEIFAGRFRRIAAEDHPMLESVDEVRLSTERDYASQDPLQNLSRWREARTALVKQLREFPEGAWLKTAHREFVGDVDGVQLAAIVLGHDSYHLRQAADFVARL